MGCPFQEPFGGGAVADARKIEVLERKSQADAL
jgi:hypothetical protein